MNPERPRLESAAQVRNNLLGHARGDLRLLETSDHFLSKYLDSKDPSLRSCMQDIVRREIEALEAVDTENTSAEEVRTIARSFHEEREALEKTLSD